MIGKDKFKYSSLISAAVGLEKENIPMFYVVGGSHMAGFPSEEGGDVDIRGFHLSPAQEYLKLGGVKQQIIINQSGITDGFEEYEDIELVSYELKKFGVMLHKTNFNVLEWLYHGDVIWKPNHGSPIPKLKKIMRKYLPGDVPIHYRGMAHQNYMKYLSNPKSSSYQPTAKKYLYVIRGLLAAEFTNEYGAIEANLDRLSKNASEEDENLIEKLIHFKQDHHERVYITPELKKGAEEIVKRYYAIEYPSKSKEGLEDDLNGWMLDVRERWKG